MKKYPNDLIGDIMKASANMPTDRHSSSKTLPALMESWQLAYRKYPPYSRTEKTKLSVSSQKTDWKHTHPYYLH